jgi:hypothetical protein
LLILVISMRCLESGNDAAAGLLIAIAGALRIYPLAVGGCLVLRGRWHAITRVAIGLAVAGIISLVVAGSRVNLSYLNGLNFTLKLTTRNPAMSALLTRILPSSSSRALKSLVTGSADATVIALASIATLGCPSHGRFRYGR